MQSGEDRPLKQGKDGWYNRYIKRGLDLLLAGVLAIPATPVVALCYFAIKRETNGPAFFVQTRPGYQGKPFRLYKLRSMRVETERDGRSLTDAERLTRIGRVIRACSLDELPQLYNVLRGDMSLLGPRPLLMDYLPLYSPEQRRRHEVRPGLSGWAQVNGRNALSWEERFALDVWYVDHVSLGLDLRIFGMTVWNVLRRQGISAADAYTMEAFTGAQNAESGEKDGENTGV